MGDRSIVIVASSSGVVRVTVTSSVDTYVEVHKSMGIHQIENKAVNQAEKNLRAEAKADVHWGEKTVESEEI